MSDDTTTSPRLDAAWVVQTAALTGLSIAPERLPGVVATLDRLGQVATIVNATTLSADDESGTIWKP